MDYSLNNHKTRVSPILIIPNDNLMITRDSTPQLIKTFPSAYRSTRDKIGLLGVSLYYSWDNITTAFNNTTLSYTWNGVNYPVTFSPGFYQEADINTYIQQAMFINKHYLIDANGFSVFYISLALNQIYYAMTLICSPLPTSLPSGWTNPNSIILDGKTPQLVISSNNFGKLIGFLPGSYPALPATTTFTSNSNIAPQITPVTMVNVVCNFVNDNTFSCRPSIVGSFSPQVQFGALLNYNPTILSMYEVTPGIYPNIQVSFVDQDYRPLIIKDYDSVQVAFNLERG